MVFPLLALLIFQLPAGEIVPSVTCASDPTQSYALYLPPGYTPARSYPVLFAFDPGARGRLPVERYQAAAEKYGYIVAGSNNSRNGINVTTQMITTLTGDVMARFNVDPRRIYLAGMSGGARVATSIALGSGDQIAGVIVSSAGFPDAEPRKQVPFAVFGTAGTEDFNHLEMRRLDAALTTPHRVAFFDGGHVWLSSELAVEAIEWMELQAMKSGRAPKDQASIDAFFDRRLAAVAADRTDKDAYLALESIVADFTGVKDVSAQAARVKVLADSKPVKDAIKKDADLDAREMLTLQEMTLTARKLASPDERADALAELRVRWQQLSAAAKKAADSPERRMARRVISLLNQSSTTSDAAYRRIIEEFRNWRRP